MADYSKRIGTNVTPAPPEPEPVELQSPLAAHRQARFLDLGFSEVDAALLADTRGDDGFPLYWGQASRLLAAGCTHAQVVGIYA